MFSKSSGQKQSQRALENNAIAQHFDVGRMIATGGPEGVWRIHQAVHKIDGKEASVFVFDKRSVEKLHKPKRKDQVTELLKIGLGFQQCYRHPRLLQVVHGPEESAEALAFASEPIIASLANILSAGSVEEARESNGGLTANSSSTSLVSLPRKESTTTTTTSSTSTATTSSATTSGTGATAITSESSISALPKVKYSFIDVEHRYGLAQITEALTFLHVTCRYVHRNVCPNAVYVTKPGTWKLAGLEFLEKLGEIDSSEVSCQPWTNRLPKIVQPDLNFIAPETQHKSVCSISSDAYSLGMLMVAVFNNGNSLVQANHSSNAYFKQAGIITEQVKAILPRIPVGLQEAVTRLVNPDTRQRPTTQLLSLIQYFSDPAVQALQFLDVISMKDPSQKAQFFRSTLTEIFPFIPRKLWFQHTWPILEQEIRTAEVLAAVLEPVLFLVKECHEEEFRNIILPAIKPVLNGPKSIQASVTLVENLPLLLEKSSEHDVHALLLPTLFTALESNMSQIQMAAVTVIPSVLDYFPDAVVRNEILPKTRTVYEQNGNDVKIVLAVLACVAKILNKLEKNAIIDEVLPLLLEVKLQEVNILVRVLEIYRMMLSDRRYGLSVNLLATRVLPLLIPQLVNPQLQYEHFVVVHEVLQEMFDTVDRHQRNKLKLDDAPKLPEWLRLRKQHSSADMSVPNLVIRRPSVVQAPSAAMADFFGRNKHSLASRQSSGGNSGGSSPENSNYLRVSAAFGQRRLSDNVLTAPGTRRLSGVFSSQPGSTASTPGGDLCGFPIRRHSSAAFAANRRYSSNALLSPSTASQLHRQLGGSMPNCTDSVSLCSSRRSSRASGNYPGHYSAGPGSRRSSGGSSRRESFVSPMMEEPENVVAPSRLLQSIGSGVYQLFGKR